MFSPALEDLTLDHVPGQGRISPRASVTLSKTDKRIASIPVEAESFAFIYPRPDVADAVSPEELQNPKMALIAIGGFAYWDANGNVCGVNSIGSGFGLNFNGPYLLRSQPGCRLLRSQLYAAGRVARITMRELVASGVRGFCWILPGEKFDGDDHNVGSKLWRHGAFAYFYDENFARLDCIYTVTDAPQVAVDKTLFQLARSNKTRPDTDGPPIRYSSKMLGALGPFKMKPIDFVSIGFSFGPDSYQVDTGTDALSGIGFEENQAVGSLSPMAPVTLDSASKQAAGIPVDADAFSFAYPVRSMTASQILKVNAADLCNNFVALGGFVYFSGGKLVGVNALSSGFGLKFNGPLSLLDHSCTALRSALYAAERVEQLTLPSLTACGIVGLCWVLPAEQLPGLPLGTEEQWPHGAFVYFFDDSLQDRDCFYPVALISEEEHAAFELARRSAAAAATTEAERDLVEELYGDDLMEQVQEAVSLTQTFKAARIGALGPFKMMPCDYISIGFRVQVAPTEVGGTGTVGEYKMNMKALPAPPPPAVDNRWLKISNTRQALKGARMSLADSDGIASSNSAVEISNGNAIVARKPNGSGGVSHEAADVDGGDAKATEKASNSDVGMRSTKSRFTKPMPFLSSGSSKVETKRHSKTTGPVALIGRVFGIDSRASRMTDVSAVKILIDAPSKLVSSSNKTVSSEAEPEQPCVALEVRGISPFACSLPLRSSTRVYAASSDVHGKRSYRDDAGSVLKYDGTSWRFESATGASMREIVPTHGAYPRSLCDWMLSCEGLSATFFAVEIVPLSDTDSRAVLMAVDEFPSGVVSVKESVATEGNSEEITISQTILPPCWMEAKTADGQTYFWNTDTRETRWEMPKIAHEDHVPDPQVSANSGVQAVSIEGGTMDMAALVYKKYNKDKSATLSFDEFIQLCEDLDHALDAKTLALGMRLLDLDGYSGLTMPEFMRWWKLGEARWEVLDMSAENEQRVQELADYYDSFGATNGILSEEQLKFLHANLFANSHTLKGLDSFIADVDIEGDGCFTLHKFHAWFFRENKERAVPPIPSISHRFTDNRSLESRFQGKSSSEIKKIQKNHMLEQAGVKVC